MQVLNLLLACFTVTLLNKPLQLELGTRSILYILSLIHEESRWKFSYGLLTNAF